MAKIPEAEKRLFKNIFICRKCKTKVRANPMKISERRISCRRCNCKDFKPVRKK
ncbi:MAG: 50S ribosomal protein L40e [Candidatus Woesearchaeota archaeon]